MNFCERFLNVHVGESNRGNYAIETLILEMTCPPKTSPAEM